MTKRRRVPAVHGAAAVLREQGVPDAAVEHIHHAIEQHMARYLAQQQLGGMSNTGPVPEPLNLPSTTSHPVPAHTAMLRQLQLSQADWLAHAETRHLRALKQATHAAEQQRLAAQRHNDHVLRSQQWWNSTFIDMYQITIYTGDVVFMSHALFMQICTAHSLALDYKPSWLVTSPAYCGTQFHYVPGQSSTTIPPQHLQWGQPPPTPVSSSVSEPGQRQFQFDA